jgi:hypothetical protein
MQKKESAAALVIIVMTLALVSFLALRIAAAPTTTTGSGGNTIPTGNVSKSCANSDVGKLCASQDSQIKTFFGSGLYWVFTSSATNVACQTSPDGVTWSSGTAIVDAPPVDDENTTFSAYYNATTNIMYYAATWPSANEFQVRWGTLSSSGCGSIDWAVSKVNHTSTYTKPSVPTITQDSSGDIWVSFGSRQSTTQYDEVWECATPVTSCIWILNHSFTGTSPHSQFFGILNNMGSNHVSIALGCTGDTPTCGPALINVTTWNGSAWGSLTTIPTNRVYADSGSVISVGNSLYAAFATSTDSVDFWHCTYPCTSITQSTFDTGLVYGVSLSASSNTGSPTLWLIAFAANKTNLFIQNSTNSGSTWGSPVVVEKGAYWSHGNDMNVMQYSNGNELGIMYGTGTSIPYLVNYTVMHLH